MCVVSTINNFCKQQRTNCQHNRNQFEINHSSQIRINEKLNNTTKQRSTRTAHRQRQPKFNLKTGIHDQLMNEIHF